MKTPTPIPTKEEIWQTIEDSISDILIALNADTTGSISDDIGRALAMVLPLRKTETGFYSTLYGPKTNIGLAKCVLYALINARMKAR
jgi:hypothetical protein